METAQNPFGFKQMVTGCRQNLTNYWHEVVVAEVFTLTKLTLPEQKPVNVKKNDQVIKTINVRRKSKHFSTRSARMF